MMLVLMLFATFGMVAYCLWLSRVYKKVEADMSCLYHGTVYHVLDVVYDRNDWFMRKVRLHTDTYPYVLEVLISEVRPLT